MATDEKITCYFAADDLAKAREVANRVGADTVQKFGVKAINAFVSYFEWATERGLARKNALGEEVLQDRATREEELMQAIQMLASALENGDSVNLPYLFASLNIEPDDMEAPKKKRRTRK